MRCWGASSCFISILWRTHTCTSFIQSTHVYAVGGGCLEVRVPRDVVYILTLQCIYSQSSHPSRDRPNSPASHLGARSAPLSPSSTIVHSHTSHHPSRLPCLSGALSSSLTPVPVPPLSSLPVASPEPANHPSFPISLFPFQPLLPPN